MLRTIHIQLGQALRRLGRTDEAAVHFAEAERTSAEGTDAAREQMTRYMTDAPAEAETDEHPDRAPPRVVPAGRTHAVTEAASSRAG